MKVYVLTYEYTYEPGYIVGAFSSEAKAMEARGRESAARGYIAGYFCIHEFDLDEWDDNNRFR